jgi:hypothetical protein
MSLLPQRKKSAEEIAQLRESFGLPGASPPEVNPPVQREIRSAPAPQSTPDAVPPIAAQQQPVILAPSNNSLPQPIDLPEPREPKPVKSLRKSEQKIPPRARPSSEIANSKIPVRRRSDQELNEFRRREALSNLAPKPNPQSLVAHLAIIIPAYLFVFASVIGCFGYDIEMWIVASLLAVALVIAAFIFVKKPLSRYHAAFIAVSSLFVIIFGTFHYFPHLLNGT